MVFWIMWRMILMLLILMLPHDIPTRTPTTQVSTKTCLQSICVYISMCNDYLQSIEHTPGQLHSKPSCWQNMWDNPGLFFLTNIQSNLCLNPALLVMVIMFWADTNCHPAQLGLDCTVWTGFGQRDVWDRWPARPWWGELETEHLAQKR